MHEVISLDRLDIFLLEIKKEVLSTFVLTFQDSLEFVKTHKDEFLPLDEIEFECLPYITTDRFHNKVIFRKDYDTILVRVYKNLVCKVLNKKVDEGELELCWDNNVNDFFWRDKRSSRKKKI